MVIDADWCWCWCSSPRNEWKHNNFWRTHRVPTLQWLFPSPSSSPSVTKPIIKCKCKCKWCNNPDQSISHEIRLQHQSHYPSASATTSLINWLPKIPLTMLICRTLKQSYEFPNIIPCNNIPMLLQYWYVSYPCNWYVSEWERDSSLFRREYKNTYK